MLTSVTKIEAKRWCYFPLESSWQNLLYFEPRTISGDLYFSISLEVINTNCVSAASFGSKDLLSVLRFHCCRYSEWKHLSLSLYTSWPVDICLRAGVLLGLFFHFLCSQWKACRSSIARLYLQEFAQRRNGSPQASYKNKGTFLLLEKVLTGKYSCGQYQSICCHNLYIFE